ncbi:MAG: C1 family peptidase [Phycisphaerales bacterium]|nr:C1 family peptidase [Phycisphaerales bacterium]
MTLSPRQLGDPMETTTTMQDHHQICNTSVDCHDMAEDRGVRPGRRPVLLLAGTAFLAIAVTQSVTMGQEAGASGLSAADITALKDQAVRDGWTFSVSANPATKYDLSELTGLVVPDNWRQGAPFDNAPPQARGVLPEAFDWRNVGGVNYCTPVRDQAGCGSCWAFAVIGSMEAGIKIGYGTSTDLSEQWLVSCCGLGGCSGEWPGNAADKLLANGASVDVCGDYGAVMESEYPYVASDGGCACPYDHPYTIENWAFIGPEWGTPSRTQLKQAILDHGPITVCVAANGAFMSYGGGVYNVPNDSSINHAVVLVGWDDSQGEEGVWFLRNSWGSGWGEGGYMRIEYDNSSIGYNALYLDLGDTPNGACCFGNGCLFGPEENCLSIGGTFLGGAVTCSDDACADICPADVTGDAQVDTNDVLAVLAAWDCSTCPDEDIDGDGIVATNDILDLIAAWGNCN